MGGEKLKRRWYDLEVQKLTGSIIASVIFHCIKSFIDKNTNDGERAFRYKCFSHLGKPGVCITYAEIADYLGTDRARIAKAITKLKDINLIGMDYVSIEAMRAPFLFILDVGNEAIKNQKKHNLRYYFIDVMKKVKCFNAAVIHGHIAFRNEITETRKGGPLVQSFQMIGENVGLTPNQVKLSLKNLVDNELVLTNKSQDRRYSLVAVGLDQSKSIGWSIQNNGLVNPKVADDQSKTCDYQESRCMYENRGGEKTPPFSSTKNEEKKEEKLVRGFLSTEFSEADLANLISLSNGNDILVDKALTRYHQRCDELKVTRLPDKSVYSHLLKFLEWGQENIATKVAVNTAKEKAEEESKRIQREQDAKDVAYSIEIAKANHKARLNKPYSPPQEAIQSVELLPPSKVVNMKSIESPEEKQKRIQASEEAELQRIYELWDSFSESEQRGTTKEAFIALYRGSKRAQKV